MDALEIVKRLAAVDEPLDYEFYICELCGWQSRDDNYDRKPEPHNPECPWAAARAMYPQLDASVDAT
jgi:hypothetical protein